MNFMMAVEGLSYIVSMMLTLLGVIAVFTGVIAAALIVFLIIYIRRNKKGQPAPADRKTPAATPAPAPAVKTKLVPARGSSGEIKLNSVDDKTAAVLMAIVADGLNLPLNELRFISIKEINK